MCNLLRLFSFLIPVFFAPFSLSADTFTDAYLAADNAMWTGSIYGSLDNNAKAAFRQNVVTLVGLGSSLADWQKVKLSSLFNNIQKSNLFLPTEKTDYASLQSQIGSSVVVSVANSSTSTVIQPIVSVGYRSLSARLNDALIQISKIKVANDVLSIINTLSNLLIEYYGSEKDKGLFLMNLNSLLQQAKFLGVDTAQIVSLQNNVQNVTNANRINFLERVNVLTNFTDPTERTLFINVIINLHQNLSKLSNDEITRFHVALTVAYSSSNFIDSDKKTILSIANEIVDYFNANRAGGGSASGSGSSTGNDTQDNFGKLLAGLQSDFAQMNNSYKQGDLSTALSMKTSNFYAPLDNMQNNFIGDMITSSYLQLPQLKQADGSVLTLPSLQNNLIDEQQALLSFFDQVLASSRLFTNDATKIKNLKSGFGFQGSGTVFSAISVEIRLKYLENLYGSTILSSENQKRFLYHLHHLILGMFTQDPSRILNSDQQNRLTTLLNSLISDTSFSSYTSILQAFMTLLNQGLSGAVSSIAQTINNQRVVIQLKNYPGTFWGAYSNGSSYFEMGYSSYKLEPQNILILTTSDASLNAGEWALRVDQLTTSSASSFVSVDQTSGQLNVVQVSSISDNQKFLPQGSSLDNFKFKNKLFPNAFLTYFNSGQLALINPLNQIPNTTDLNTQYFSLMVLSNFEQMLLGARAANSVATVINGYRSVLGMVVDNITASALLDDLQYFINQKSSVNGLIDVDIQSLQSFLSSLQSNNNFLPFLSRISQIKTALGNIVPASQSTTSAAGSGIVTGSAVQSTANLLSIFKTGSKFSFQIGNVAGFDLRFLSVAKVEDDYLVGTVQTNPTDPSVQFLIHQPSGSGKIALESIQYPGMVISYAVNKAMFGRDLELTPIPANGAFVNNQLFTVLSSTSSSNKLCLVNAESGGYLTVMSDESCMVTNFTQALPESAASLFDYVVLGKDIENLSAIISGVGSESDKFAALTNYFKSLSSPNLINTALRATYDWLLTIRQDNNSWRALVSSGVTQKMSTFLATLLVGSVKKVYQSYTNIITVIRSLLEFSSDLGFSIMPDDKNIFWLNDPSFIFNPTTKVGLTFAFKTNGILTLTIAPTITNDQAKKYEIRIGDIDDSGARVATILKSGDQIDTEICTGFDPNNIVEYQVTFDQGNITLFGPAGQILSFSDTNNPLIDLTSTSPSMIIGFSVENDAVYFDKVSAGLDLQYLSIVNQITKEGYSKAVTRVLTTLNNEKSVSDKFLQSLVEAKNLSTLPQRLFGENSDWDKLKQGLLALKKQPFVVRNYSANSNIDLALSKLSENLTRITQRGFLISLIEVLSFYNVYPAKQDDAQRALQLVVFNNISRLISLSFSDEEKSDVQSILTGKISTESLFDAGTIASFQNALSAQIKLSFAAGSSLDQEISQLNDFVTKITTTTQRTTLLGLIDQIISSIKQMDSATRNAAVTSISNLQAFLSNLNSNTFFKDILGSISYFSWTLNNFSSIEDQMDSLIGQLNGVINAATFMNNFQPLVNTVTSMLSMGMDVFHGQVQTRVLSRLASIRNYPQLGSYLSTIDFLSGYVQVRGDINSVIATLQVVLGKIQRINERDAFLSQIDSGLVSYIENQIKLGKVNENDRAIAKSFLSTVQANNWFKDATAVTKLQNFISRLNAQTNPMSRFAQLKNDWTALNGSDSQAFENFIKELVDLYDDFKSYVVSGGSYTANDASTLNAFIDSLDTASNSQNSTGAGYLLYIKRYQASPNFQLTNLKLDITGELDLISFFNNLNATYLSTDFSVLANRQNFVNSFNQLMDKWRMVVVFDSSKLNNQGSSLSNFYKSMSNFFDNVGKNVLLIPNAQLFAQAKADMIEDQYSALDKIVTMKSFLLISGLGSKTPQQVLDAVTAIVKDFKDYQMLNFSMPDSDLATMIDLLNICKNKVELTTVSEQVDNLIKSLQTSPTMIARIAYLNQQLESALTNYTTLTNIQMDNLVSACVSANKVLKNTPVSELTKVDLSSMLRYISSLLSKNIFTGSDLTDLTSVQSSLTSLNNSIATTSSTTLTTATSTSATPTTNQSQTTSFQSYAPVVSYPTSTSNTQPAGVANSAGVSNFYQFGNTANQSQATISSGYRVKGLDYGGYQQNPYAKISY